MLGIIRVLTTEDESVLKEHGRLMKEESSVDSLTRCIPDQPFGIYDAVTEAQAAPKIVELARTLEADERIAAISISCAADPALEEVRQAVSLPVIGAGVSGAYAARMISSSVAVLGITEAVPDQMRVALGPALHSVRFHPLFRKATDLHADGARKALLECAQDAEEEGATAILFACTGFSTIHLKSYFDSRLTIPSIDLVQAQAIAYTLLAVEG